LPFTEQKIITNTQR